MSDAYGFGYASQPSWMTSIQNYMGGQGGLLGQAQPQGGLLSAPPPQAPPQPSLQYPHRPGVNTVLGALDNLLLGGAVQKAQLANYEAKMANTTNTFLPQALGQLFGGNGPPTNAPPLGAASPAPNQSAPGPAMAPQLGGGQGAPPQMAGVNPVGHGLNLRDPATQRTIATLGMLGSPLAGTLTTLGSATMPKFSAVRPGGFMANEATGEMVGNSAPDGGTQNIPDPNNPGQYINVPVAGAATNAAAYAGATAGGKAAGEALGALPYVGPTAQARAAGEGAGAAPWTVETHPGPNGAPVTASRAHFLGTPPLLGQSPAQANFATDQAKDLSGIITQDQAARQPAQQQRDDALRAITIASQTPLNPGRPLQYQAEKIINSIPGFHDFAQKDIDNISAYEQISTKSLLGGAKSLLPTPYNERELTLTKGMYGSIKDPNSAALMAAGIQGALGNKALARADYADRYDPASGLTRQQYEAGWANTPQGRASIYADPVWQQIKIGGKPVAQPFTARNGQKYIAVGAGLGKPTFIPAN